MVRFSQTDGGYGWVIVFSSFLVHFILLGQVRSFGVLYVALLRLFERSAAETASLNGCFNTVRVLLGTKLREPGESLYTLFVFSEH